MLRSLKSRNEMVEVFQNRLGMTIGFDENNIKYVEMPSGSFKVATDMYDEALRECLSHSGLKYTGNVREYDDTDTQYTWQQELNYSMS